eukprot:TRINITY_DN856_c0_g1_i4.p1 TRINITY_DN856_c0_g1~~TRINITY_DN856_c0_g1_i4.p1  ORF type:complete len:351 (+),score=95.84 TRINITY_DN856_c0_g1_i4:161-1213(+)
MACLLRPQLQISPARVFSCSGFWAAGRLPQRTWLSTPAAATAAATEPAASAAAQQLVKQRQAAASARVIDSVGSSINSSLLAGVGPGLRLPDELMPASKTGGTRGGMSRNGSILYNGRPVKRLIQKLKQSSGRNHSGAITVWNRGGGASKFRRWVDFHRRLLPNMPAVVRRLERDPTRTAFIALICYRNGTLSYVLAAEGLLPGMVISTSLAAPNLRMGNAVQLGACPIGLSVFNVELLPGRGGQLARAAGASAKVLKRFADHTLLKLTSGEHRMVPAKCLATVGEASNVAHTHDRLRKAGQSRHLGRRPHVRGVAMNPIGELRPRLASRVSSTSSTTRRTTSSPARTLW